MSIIKHKNFYCILITMLFVCRATVNAQMTVGIDVGLTNSILKIKPSYTNLKISSKEGYMVNINFQGIINNKLSVVIAPGVIQKNYTITNINGIYQNINNTYLHLPLSLQYDLILTKKINISTSGGLYYAYWLKSMISGLAPNIFELSNISGTAETIKVEDIHYKYKFTSQDNKSEVGWIGRVGLKHQLSNRISCLLTGQYYQGLTSQQDREIEIQPKKTNRSIVVTSALSYRL